MEYFLHIQAGIFDKQYKGNAKTEKIHASHYVKFLSKTIKQRLKQAQYERATCPKEQLEVKFVYNPLKRREEEEVNAIVMFSQSQDDYLRRKANNNE